MVDIANDLNNFGFVGIFWGSSDLQFEFTLVLKDMEMHFGQRLHQKTWVLVDMVNGASPASNSYHFLSMSNLFHINWIWFSSEDFKLWFRSPLDFSKVMSSALGWSKFSEPIVPCSVLLLISPASSARDLFAVPHGNRLFFFLPLAFSWNILNLEDNRVATQLQQ